MSRKVIYGDTQNLSELRILLMGYNGAGKSLAGNLILGIEEFDLKRTAKCVKRQREVANRHITVVEAPGWWRTESVEKSTESLKQEILLSVSLCPPGPHIVLLVIPVDIRFRENERKVLQGYVELLSERVWSHTIVLFTFGDFLGDTSIEQHIEREGEDLQWLLEKCGNRYHVLNNQNSSDDTQIKDLLEKIDETVTENNSCHFELERTVLQSMEERRKAEKEKAEEQMNRVKKRRAMIRSQMSVTQKLSALRIVLMGNKGTGKSSARSLILGREEFDLKTTDQCVKRQREVADRHITVVEAPGWWRNEPVEQSSESLKQEILLSVSLCPHAVLLVVRVDTRFTEDKRKVLHGYVELLSERVWSHTIVLFTFGDFLGDTSIEQHIEREGEDLQWLVEKCGNRYHVLNNQNSSDDTQIKDLLEKIEETVTENNGCHFEMDSKKIKMMEKSSGEKMSDGSGAGKSDKTSPHSKLLPPDFGDASKIRACRSMETIPPNLRGDEESGKTSPHFKDSNIRTYKSIEIPPNLSDGSGAGKSDKTSPHSKLLPPDFGDASNIRTCRSMETIPPNLSGVEMLTQRFTSAASLFRPDRLAERRHLKVSVSSLDSGYGSLGSILESEEHVEPPKICTYPYFQSISELPEQVQGDED